MTRFDSFSANSGGGAPDDARPPARRLEPLPIDRCRDLASPLRQELETLDDEARSLVNQLLAGVDGQNKDGVSFLRGAATVLLTIAAAAMETAAERLREPADVEAFRDAAEDAAQWTRRRRLKEALGDEN